jgi:hypothetical protein
VGVDRAARRLRVGPMGRMRWTAAGQTARGGLFVRWSKERKRVCCRGVGEWSCPSKGRCRRAAELVPRAVSARR